MTTDEMIAVLEAHKRGEKIEYQRTHLSNELWLEAQIPVWDFSSNNYRIAKPEPIKQDMSKTFYNDDPEITYRQLDMQE